MLTEGIDYHAVKVDAKVRQGSAPVAPKVAMRGQDGIIPRLGIIGVYDMHEVCVHQGAQRVVHRSLGQGRHLPDQAPIDLVGGGVPPDVTQELEYTETLV